MKTPRKLSNFEYGIIYAILTHICCGLFLIHHTLHTHKGQASVELFSAQQVGSDSFLHEMMVQVPPSQNLALHLPMPLLHSSQLPVEGGEACMTAESLGHFGEHCHNLYNGRNSPSPQYLCWQAYPPETGAASKLSVARHDLVLPTHLHAATKCKRIELHPTSQRFSAYEFGCYSQNTKDGILLLLFRMVGVTNRRAIEIAGGVGWENNAINLVVNFGFEALFFEGDTGNSLCASNFIHQHTDIRERIKWSSDFVTCDNLNAIITAQTGWTGDIDLFSLDIDGMDYWIWDALTIVRPHVVVVEIQEVWGAFESKTRPYDPHHVSPEIPAMGASLAAFVYLAKRRGYRLVGCIKLGYNAFFVHENAVPGGLDALFGSDDYNPTGYFGHVDTAWANVLRERRRAAEKYSWIDPSETTNKTTSNCE